MSLSNSTLVKFIDDLEIVAKINGFKKYRITIDNNLSNVEGFLSTITKVQIISPDKQLDLIIKSCGSNDKIRTVAPISSIFRTESYMYDTIFPLLKQFENDHGLTATELAPDYYYSCKKNEYDAIIIQNLKATGYELYNSQRLFDDTHVTLVIQLYAKFHAASLAYKDQNPVRFKTLIDHLDTQWCAFKKDEFKGLMVKHLKKAITALDPVLDEEPIKVYEKFISEFDEVIRDLFDAVDEFSVIVHGDCWKNNIMFKYGDESDTSRPTDVRLIDFQASSLQHPLLDIAQFFYACGSKEVIDNMDTYLNLYHESLSSHLKKLGSDPDILFPHKSMLEHWKRFSRFGLIMRPGALVLLLGDQLERKGISDNLELGGTVSDLFDYTISDMEQYHDLCRHTILHFIKNGFI